MVSPLRIEIDSKRCAKNYKARTCLERKSFYKYSFGIQKTLGIRRYNLPKNFEKFYTYTPILIPIFVDLIIDTKIYS